MNEQESSHGPDAEDLQQLLDEAEQRKEEQIKRVGGRFTLIVTIPILLLFAWAGIFLIRYNIENPPGNAAPANATTPAAVSAPLSDEEKDMARYDLFRDKKDRVVKTNALGLETKSEELIDKEDIHFALELLNFMHSPTAPPHAKP